MNAKLERTLESLTVQELIVVKKLVDRLINSQQKNAKKQLQNKIQDLVKSHGLDIEMLVWKPEESAKKKKQYPPKYQNPKNPSEVWTGLGKRPKWVVAILAEGVKLEELLINN